MGATVNCRNSRHPATIDGSPHKIPAERSRGRSSTGLPEVKEHPGIAERIGFDSFEVEELGDPGIIGPQ